MTAAGSDPVVTENDTSVERTSDRELTVTRTIAGPAHLVFEAWTNPELFRRWWVPKSFPITLVSCEMDVRIGGGYRLQFEFEGSTADFYGKYLEVVPNSRLAWSNEEADGEGPVTTATFEDHNGKTRVVVSDRYPSKEALDEAIEAGSNGIASMPEALGQLEELLASQAGDPGLS